MKLITSMVVALAFAVTASAATDVKPTVRLAQGDTAIAISGHGFKAGEKVNLLVFHSGARVVKRVSVTAKGRFWLRVLVGKVDTCKFAYVSATGDRGSKATFRHVPAPCGPPIAP